MSPPQSPSAKDRRTTVGFSTRGGGGSGLSSPGNNSNKSSPHSRSSSPTQFDFSPNQGQGQGAMDARMVSTISQSLGAAISNMYVLCQATITAVAPTLTPCQQTPLTHPRTTITSSHPLTSSPRHHHNHPHLIHSHPGIWAKAKPQRRR